MVEKHGGRFPTTFAEALALPGVGRYTAGAVCSIAYNQPTPVLDGNVMRVLSRVFGVAGDPRGQEANRRLWGLAQELVGVADGVLLRQGYGGQGWRMTDGGARKGGDCEQKETKEAKGMAEGREVDGRNCGRLNEALMELGALVCAPRQPRCAACPLQRICFARRENRVREFPMLRPAGKASRRRFVAFIVKRNGRYLARQRPGSGVNAHLWEFPNVEIAPEERNPAAAAAPFVLTGTKPVWRARHSITRYRILLEAYPAELPGRPAKGAVPGVWRTRAQLERLPFTGAHRKILAALRDEIKLEKRAVAA
jgi:A/G-specific adenine glycosylase